MDSVTQYALAYALTTSAGLRGLLTLAAVSVAIHFGLFTPPESFAWLGSNTVTLALVSVALVDLIGDKIPVVDHALHTVQTLVKPAAAAILVGGVAHTQSHGELYMLMALGALNAVGVHAASAAARGASSLLTGGLGNPVLSTIEDGVSVFMIVLALLAPLVAAVIAVMIVVFIVRAARAFRKRQHGSAPS